MLDDSFDDNRDDNSNVIVNNGSKSVHKKGDTYPIYKVNITIIIYMMDWKMNSNNTIHLNFN